MTKTKTNERLCACPLCDNATESGCTNSGTILIDKIWLCPACADSVAVNRECQPGAVLLYKMVKELGI